MTNMAEREDSNTIQSGTQLFLPFSLEVEIAEERLGRTHQHLLCKKGLYQCEKSKKLETNRQLT